MSDKTREPQYQHCLDLRDATGLTRLGLMSSQVWHDDPKRLGFVLARYKFVAKLLAGSERVLEVGCADAFATRVVCQAVQHVTAIDFDPVFVKSAHDNMHADWPFDCCVHDMIAGPVPSSSFDGAYSLDVIEHIDKRDERRFVGNICASLAEHGVLVVGTPSLESQIYASPGSKAGHVNCKTAEELRTLLREYFHNVFVFSMNDEVVHTGYYPMAQYLFALCCGKRAVQA